MYSNVRHDIKLISLYLCLREPSHDTTFYFRTRVRTLCPGDICKVDMFVRV